MAIITFAELICAGRLAAGLTQQELANRAKLHRVYIAQLETGKRPDPGYSVVKRLCKALGKDFADAIKADIDSDLVSTRKHRKKSV